MSDAERLTSPLLERAGFAHAFFTRRGGVSAAPFDTLSFWASGGDAAEAVAENRLRAARALGCDVDRLYYLSQVHGIEARVLSGRERPDDVVLEKGDVTLSREPGVACGVRSADCVPVLLADRSGAVAAVHSGWRGTEQNVVSAAIHALRELVGADLELVAAIGPHLERCCFEVGEDVAARLAAASTASKPVWTARELGVERPHVDLRAIVRAELEAAGVPGAAIDDVPGCTVCDGARFFSYRRDGARGGRLLSAIVARA